MGAEQRPQHSRAAFVHIYLDSRGDQVRLEIRDDGVGFDPQSTPDDNRRHLGIANMRQRIAEIGGSLEIVSRPGAGR
ncbi:MAG: hypothetical protein R2856_29285 [Caldilineaceae bacterium]